MGKYVVVKGEPSLVNLGKELWFGKHKGKTIRQIIDDHECFYIEWCIQKEIFELDCAGMDYLEDAKIMEPFSHDYIPDDEKWGDTWEDHK